VVDRQEDVMSSIDTHQSRTPAPAQTPSGPREVDTLIVGAGQAGLSTAYWLGRLGCEALVVDAHARVGDQWRERYASLRLNTPAKFDGQPGMPFPAPRNSFPTGGELADYFEEYARRMQLQVRGSTVVTRVEPQADGTWLVTCTDTTFVAHQVVVATGGEQHPKVPDFAEQLDPGIRQLHSRDYRGPEQLLPGPVLVVGASQSGADLAAEAGTSGHRTWLSGHVRGEIPVPLMSRRARVLAPFLWFLANHVLTLSTPIGRRARGGVRQGGTPLVRTRREDLLRAGVTLVEERTVGVEDGKPRLADGRVLEVSTVLWCTGYRQDFSMVPADVIGPDGWPLQERGVVPGSPGLYFGGLLFQAGFYSMLVGGAARDSRRTARHIAQRSRARVTAL
jgi:putative flavoprotein involved in K+ transport